MRKVILLISLVSFLACGQDKPDPTREFAITGKLKNPMVIKTADLLKHPVVKYNDIVITGHTGEKKSDVKEIKGVLIRDVLGQVQLDAESPKLHSEFYFVFEATDGFKVVFSWNELFNSKVGDTACLVTEKNGISLTELGESISILSPQDYRTGRRYLKNLTRIHVARAE